MTVPRFILAAGVVLLALPAQGGDSGEGSLEAKVAALVGRLGSESFEDREAAYETLSGMGTRVAPYLAPALESEDPEVARLVRQLLDSIRRRAESDLLALLDTRDPRFAKSEEFERLVSAGRKLLPALYRVLDEEDAQFPTYSYYRLRNTYLVIGRLATNNDIDRLFGRLGHENAQHRYLLRQEVFESLDKAKVLDKSFAILVDEKPGAVLRANVLEMLTTWSPAANDPRLPKHATALLEHEDARVRAAAARHFGIRRRDEALPRLLELTEDEEASVRAAALRAIRWYRTSKVRETLQDALSDPEAEARAAALESLRSTATPDLAPRIRPFLKDPDPSVRSNAAQLLGRLGDKSALPTLLEILGQRDVEFLTRTLYAVLDAVGRIADPAALEPLWKLLEDAKEQPSIRNLRYRILSTVVQVGGVEILPRIRPYLADSSIQNRSYILDAIAKLEAETTIPILLDALESKDVRLRTSAVRGLARRKHAEAAPLVAMALEEETETWFLTEAVRALTVFGHRESIPAILELLKGDAEDPNRTGLFFALLRAVNRFAPREAAPRVAEIAGYSKSYLYLCTDVLGRLGEPSGVPGLKKLFDAEKDGAIRQRMARSLARMGLREPLLEMCRSEGPSETVWALQDLIALGRYEAARENLTVLLEQSPENPLHLYNMGCILALTGKKDEAFETLQKSLEGRAVTTEKLLTDPDLDPIREDPRFAALLEKGK